MNTALADHLAQLGLTRAPFPPTPDSTGYYLSPALERGQVEIAQCLRTRTGIALLTGEIGTGKTTFLRRLINGLEADGMTVSLVFNTFLQGADLLAAVLRDFGLTPTGTPADDIEHLNRFLIERWQQQVTCVLVIDDAQNLDVASLELLRLLTCLESGQEKLLQIVIAGQPELLTLLARTEMRQLASRITTHMQLKGLDASTLSGYVAYRLASAGAADTITLSADGAKALYAHSRGNQRRVHLIMDRCLYGLYGQQIPRRIDARMVHVAADESGFRPAPVPRRLQPQMALAASLALAIAGALTWSLITSLPHSQATAAQSPPLPVVATSVASTAAVASPVAAQDRCTLEPLDRTASVLLPASAMQAPDVPHACVAHHNGQWRVSWQPLPSRPSLATDPVLALQHALRELGQYDGQPDGVYGPLTERAIARLQYQHHLPVTSQVDALTEHLVSALASAPPASPVFPSPTGTLLP